MVNLMNQLFISQIEKDFNNLWFNDKPKKETVIKDKESINLLRKLFMEKELQIAEGILTCQQNIGQLSAFR